LISVAVGSAVLLVTTASLAVPFNSFDPKSMAMGGAGVAVANPSTAPFFNPALLSVADKDDDFSLELPIIGVRVFDPDDFADAVDDFDDGVIDNLVGSDVQVGSIDQYNATPDQANTDQVISDITAVNNEVLTLSDKPFQFEGGAGMVLSIPGEKFGIAISASGSASFSGILNYADADTVNNMTDDLTALNALRVCFDNSVTQDDVNTCLGSQTFNYVDVDIDSAEFGNIVFNASSENTNDPSDILSTVRVLGIVQTEVGVTISREMAMFGTEVAVGLTPKVLSVTIFDYEVSADSADTGEIDGDDYSTDYSDFNLDVGIAIDHKNGWRSGFVIKNLIGQDYDAMNTDPVTGIETATGTVVSIKPQARVGV
ncbi:MAG: conjugal transfer protein TraF, partial [Gammaproteobacteria bacterium]|nr:conjugal transfer protein TraF [Gammaproteobacteria bacterium]